MSRKRLHKSAEPMVAGVCGGIAEFFDADPNMVRIMAVVLIVLGLGIPVIFYIVAALIMPPSPAAAAGYVDAKAECRNRCPKATAGKRPFGGSDQGQVYPAAEPSAETASGCAGPVCERFSRCANDAAATKRRWPALVVLGATLVGIGVLALLVNFIHISLWRFWPLVLIAAGLACLCTPSAKGWSLERAGSALVLITLGLVLLAWTLHLLSSLGFINTLLNLWPLILVVTGLYIIGAALRSSALKLASSLLLSSSLLAGLWFYGGIVVQQTINTPDGRLVTITVPESPALPNYAGELPSLGQLEMVGSPVASLKVQGGSASVTVLGTETDAIGLSGYSSLDKSARLYYEDAAAAAACLDLPEFDAQSPAVVFLPSSVEWLNLDFNAGATPLQLDLSELVVQELNLEVNVSTCDILLGNPSAANSELNIDSGFAAIKLRLPPHVSCVINTGGRSIVACDDASFYRSEDSWCRNQETTIFRTPLGTLSGVSQKASSAHRLNPTVQSGVYGGSGTGEILPPAEQLPSSLWLASSTSRAGGSWTVNINGVASLDLGISS